MNVAKSFIEDEYKKYKYIRIKSYGGKRTLDQNSLKCVWYKEISEQRSDVSSKDVERECKYKYGLPILRRDPVHEYVFSRAVDPLPYEKRLVVMDCFAVTSVMSVEQLTEYTKMMKIDYPYLRGNKG